MESHGLLALLWRGLEQKWPLKSFLKSAGPLVSQDEATISLCAFKAQPTQRDHPRSLLLGELERQNRVA